MKNRKTIILKGMIEDLSLYFKNPIKNNISTVCKGINGKKRKWSLKSCNYCPFKIKIEGASNCIIHNEIKTMGPSDFNYDPFFDKWLKACKKLLEKEMKKELMGWINDSKGIKREVKRV